MRLGDNAARGQIDRGDRRLCKGQKGGGRRPCQLQFQQVVGPVVLHSLYGAQQGAAGIEHLQPDQVGVVEFIVGQRGQLIAAGKEHGAAQGVGLFFGGDLGDAGGKAVLDRADQGQCVAAGAVLGGQGAVGPHVPQGKLEPAVKADGQKKEKADQAEHYCSNSELTQIVPVHSPSPASHSPRISARS